MDQLARILDAKLLTFLTNIAQNPAFQPADRTSASYIIASYSEHKNVYRLMAQVSHLSNGEKVLHASHNARSATNDNSPVIRFGACLQAFVTDHRIKPNVGDYEGHPIELYSALDPTARRMVNGNKFEFHRALLTMEKRANEHLAHLTQKYGYHFIFRIGLREFYMTHTVAENTMFFRRNPDRPDNRAQVQKICHEAFEHRLCLTAAEKMTIIMITNCNSQDANAFWSWLERHRPGYFAMQNCIALLNRVRPGHEGTRAAN